MHRFTISAALALAATSPALAGPVDVPPPLPPVIVDNCPLAFDCLYAGLELGYGQGDGDESVTGGPTIPLDFDGEVYGAFAGYNFQNGSTVFGGEVRYLHTNLTDGVAGFEVNSLLDLRARVGFAMGQDFMVYGAAGWTMAQATAAADFDMDGYNYGIGVEYNLSESFFLGADVTGRQLEGSQGGFDYETTVNTATIRAGFRF
ncbi:hypothetical protein A8B78_17780 [Jannaschia sp. EhC01]|nr:hypothetical protein A8B78_17780 [Jannaschia sp. EhC01]